ncbi:XRE family transcriptional regulator [Billgrantia antri]|uniref:XRE family transcriptional regulator n=1 Tax=Billgrantia antri TaxID=2846777 RepID=UPI003B2185A7
MNFGDFTTENFKANLKLATSYYPSVSEVCRKLRINRQQFMKYMAGTSFPSRYNLRRICDFFGFDEYEFLMPHDQFSTIIRLRPAHTGNEIVLPPGMSELLKEAQRSRGMLTKMHGYYYEYYLSYSTPRHILRAFTYIYDWKDYTLYKRMEWLKQPHQKGRPDVYKYAGIVTISGGRIHMFDQESITGSELTQKILYLNYRNRITMLTGLALGVSGGDAHEPSASRVVMEYIGRTGNLRQAISACGIFPLDSPNIPTLIREHLTDGGQVDEPLRATTI